MNLRGPALALLELESIARGFTTTDALVKRATVTIALAEPTTPGKYLLLFTGEVADVEESYRAGIEVAGPNLLDKLFLPRAAASLMRALEGNFSQAWAGSMGIVETHTAASALLAADTAVKRADVYLSYLHLARGIGGKGYFLLTGPLHMVEAGLAAAASAIEPNLLVATETIQNPHPDFIAQLESGNRQFPSPSGRG
jgi:microcompartment protein CcmL/EutN